jgi:hypothetical protein
MISDDDDVDENTSQEQEDLIARDVHMLLDDGLPHEAVPQPQAKPGGGDSEDTNQDIGFAAMYAAESDIGENIRDDVAKSLKHGLVTQMQDAKLKEAMEKHKSPMNCEPLVVPMVNPPIWSNITPKTRSLDLKLQRVQKPLIKGLTAMAKLDQQVLTQDVKDGFMLMAHANYELNCLRKEMIKPDLNPQYQHLCKPTIITAKDRKSLGREHYSLLFGTDLGKQVKDMQEEQKATSGVIKFGNFGRRGRGNRFRPYNRPNNNYRQSFQAAAAAAGWNKSSSFLGARQGFNFKQNQKPYRQRNFAQGRQTQGFNKQANNTKTSK